MDNTIFVVHKLVEAYTKVTTEDIPDTPFGHTFNRIEYYEFGEGNVYRDRTHFSNERFKGLDHWVVGMEFNKLDKYMVTTVKQFENVFLYFEEATAYIKQNEQNVYEIQEIPISENTTLYNIVDKL